MTQEELRRRRTALHITQAQLAAALGVTLNAVQHWEQGLRQTPGLLSAALWAVENGYRAPSITHGAGGL